MRRQRIRVEERVALHRNARQHRVIERPFQHVDVLPVAFEEEQAVVPVHVCDRRAGFTVGAHVRQVVVFHEPFVSRRLADAAGDIHLVIRDVIPQRFDGADIVFVTVDGGYVGHSCVHVPRSHRVARRFGLVHHGQMRLIVFVIFPAALFVASHVEEELR